VEEHNIMQKNAKSLETMCDWGVLFSSVEALTKKGGNST
jgi:hypothetical protein